MPDPQPTRHSACPGGAAPHPGVSSPKQDPKCLLSASPAAVSPVPPRRSTASITAEIRWTSGSSNTSPPAYCQLTWPEVQSSKPRPSSATPRCPHRGALTSSVTVSSSSWRKAGRDAPLATGILTPKNWSTAGCVTARVTGSAAGRLTSSSRKQAALPALCTSWLLEFAGRKETGGAGCAAL